MKKQLFTFIAGAGLYTSSFAQIQNKELKPIQCNTYEVMEEGFKADPNLRAKYNLIQSQLELEYQQALKNLDTKKTSAVPIYTIPVVFHVMGSGHTGTVTDQTFINLISYLNNDYAKAGNDIAQINPTFASLYVDAEIRFSLAQKDPLGNCTNGIIRHTSDSKYWNQSSPNYAYSGTGTNRWPVNKYLNIYIVECIASSSSPCPQTGSYVAGYTYKPGSTPYTSNGNMGDAIVLLSFNGALAQFDPHASRTISHEIGHWLNLSHTFGNTNNPEVSCGDDGIGDTPATKGYFQVNTCPSHGGGSFTGCSATENDENIMDYGSCPKMFTQGQVTAMRTAIVSTIGGRNNLWTSANYLATGLSSSYTCAPVADLKVNKTTLCSGQSITYTDLSQKGSSGSIAWTFQGGTPATSTASSVVVTYPTAGVYSVSILATNANGSNTMNKTSYITVTDGSAGIVAPYTQNFEGSGVPSDIYVVNGNVGSVAWAQNTSTGGNSTSKSIYLNNASASTGGHLDIFETGIFDFHNTTNISLSYWYAYAKKSATQADTFKVQYSLDCGGSWSNVIGIPSIATMATNSGGTTTTPLVPTSTQWKQATVSSALLSALNNKQSVKFRFYFRSDATVGSSNNIYLDEINLSGTVGLNELENAIGLTIYPNPTNSSSKVDLTITGTEVVKISVSDIIGRLVEESTTPTVNGKNITYTINKNGALAKGIYIVNIDVNNQRISKKLIIE